MHYPQCWNDELSDLKRNIQHGAPVVESTSLIYPVHGEPFREFSNDMDFSFVLKHNPDQPATDSNVVMLTACGREIHSNFVFGESARFMKPVLSMTAHGIG
jgi:hypothetical protein